ncbi:MAG: PEPxxWA-CTERM sorting domain-containing protein [Polymorphobacter sp.]
MTKFISLLLATAALAATSASAVTVTGATRIRVTNASSLTTFIQVAELQAFDVTGVNVALATNGGSASANTVYEQALPSKAIDGNTGFANDNDLYHSGGPSGDYLDITFAAANLASLTIFTRSDYANDRDEYNVSVFNAAGTTLYSGYLDGRGTAASVSTTFDATGAVPEPASWAMLIAGFGLTGAAARRRRRMVAVAA